MGRDDQDGDDGIVTPLGDHGDEHKDHWSSSMAWFSI